MFLFRLAKEYCENVKAMMLHFATMHYVIHVNKYMVVSAKRFNFSQQLRNAFLTHEIESWLECKHSRLQRMATASPRWCVLGGEEGT